MTVEREDRPADTPAAPPQGTLDQATMTSLNQQIRAVEQTLQGVAANLQTLLDGTTRRMEETESLATHVLALESILMVLLKNHPVDPQTVQQVARDKIKALTGEERENSTVQAVVEDILTSVSD